MAGERRGKAKWCCRNKQRPMLECTMRGGFLLSRAVNKMLLKDFNWSLELGQYS